MAPRNPSFDLPRWGIALCAILVIAIAGVIIFPDVAPLSSQNETATLDEDSLIVPVPGREDEIVLHYIPELNRITVIVFPLWTDDAVTLAVTRQANPNEVSNPVYGPVTFNAADAHPAIKYSYDIEETHILTVTSLRPDGVLSSRYRVSFGGRFFQNTSLEVTQI